MGMSVYLNTIMMKKETQFFVLMVQTVLINHAYLLSKIIEVQGRNYADINQIVIELDVHLSIKLQEMLF